MLNVRLPSSQKQSPLNVIIDRFNFGSNTLIDVGRQDPKMAYESINLQQVQDSVWKPRWGTGYYGQAITGESKFDGIAIFVKNRGTSTESRELIAVGGTTGKVYKSVDGGSWTQITGSVQTPGKQPYFLQVRGYLYITNTYDNLTRYDGTSLVPYTTISPVGTVTLTKTTLTTGSYNVYYQVTALNSVGETMGNTEATTTVNKIRDNWTGGEKVSLSWTAVTGALRYQIYYSDQSGNEVLLDSTTTTTYDDAGTAQPNPYVITPVDNTTGAPKFGPMELSGNRIWGTKDPTNPYRVYYGGVGQYTGYFSAFYGGGYVDLEKGSQNIPIKVVHYRTGKGDPIATVLCASPEGNGTTFQISLDSLTVGDTSFTVPTVYKIVGSIGGDAPYGVVAAGDNVVFTNKKGAYAIRTKPQIVNVLATDELTQNIRPSWRSLTGSSISNIAAYYTQGKVLFSVPLQSSDNDSIIVYDLERNNWQYYWTKGVKQFLEYTDSLGNTHLLGVPVNDSKLWEFVDGLTSDLGAPFNTSYISPLIPVSKKHTQFAQVNYAFIEVGRPKGNIYFEVLGITDDGQLKVLNSRLISSASTVSEIDFANALFGDYQFSSSEDPAPTSLAQARVVKSLKINKKVSAIQFHVYSTQANIDYTLFSLIAEGFVIPTQPKSSMKN